jgi:hypothetical protein
LFTFTVPWGWRSSGVVIAKFSGHTVAKVPQQRKIRQTTLLSASNYLKQAFEFRSIV